MVQVQVKGALGPGGFLQLVIVQVRVRGTLGREDLAWVSMMVQVQVRGALWPGGIN